MDCTIIKHPVNLSTLLQQCDYKTEEKIYSCFIKEFKSYWVSIATTVCGNKFEALKLSDADIIEFSFTDGLICYIEFLKQGKYVDKGNRIETLFFKFCLNKLLAHIQTTLRHHLKVMHGEPEKLLDAANASYDTIAEAEFHNIKEDQYAKYESGMIELGEKCVELIYLRRLKKLTEEEVGALLNIKPTSVDSSVSRCVTKLKNILDD